MLRSFARMPLAQSPVFLLALLTASIFVGEVFVMLLLGSLPTMFGWPLALVDGTLLVVLLFPVLHYSAFRPLLQALRAREQAEQSLQKANGDLETRVEERTAELQKTNEVLRVEMAERRRVEQERERLIGQLQQALAEVKQLSGLLPICSGCKKIRDDRGYWNQIELYIGSHSEAKFTHGLCPDCIKKYYPGLDA